MNDEEYVMVAFEKARMNQRYLSAQDCNDPSPEFLQEVGRIVVNKFKHDVCLMPAYGVTSENETVQKIAKNTKVLFIEFIKSVE